MADDGTKAVVAAFWELTTERQIGMVLGQIPHSRIVAYGERRGFQESMMALLTAGVRACDDEYLGYVSRRRAKQAPSG